MDPEAEIPKSESKNCLNCGSPLSDRFCPRCGQDSREIKRSVWQFALQSFETITDLDNRLWSSLFPLLFRPGYLTQRYLEGKRKRYLNPIQLYAFFSFLFFLTAYYLPDADGEKSIADEFIQDMNSNERPNSTKPKSKKDTLQTDEFQFNFRINPSEKRIDDGSIILNGIRTRYETYDSIQAALPAEKRDGWFAKKFYKKLLFFNKKAKEKDGSVVKGLIESFKDNMPTVITLLIPFAAFFLQILYYRRGLYFVEHLVLTLHIHSAAFFYLSSTELLLTVIPFLNDYSDILKLINFSYAYLAMKRFYEQGYFKTFLKFLIFLVAYLILLFLGTISNVVVSALMMD